MTTNYINRRIPFQLGFHPSGSSAEYSNPEGTYDFAFGGVAFLSAAAENRPYYRRTAPFKRDQFDSSAEPGEQTLTGWWLRSQSSFHLGAGLKYEDPTEETNRFRCETAEGVDLWTPGEVSLLPTTSQRQSGASPVLCHGATDGTTDIALFSSASTLYRVTSSAVASVTWGGTGNILSITDDGSSYYAANATSIYSGTLAGGNGSAVWDTGSSDVVIGWVKQRLMAGIGNAVYELVGGAPPTLPTATYTHPNTDWKWTAIDEGPECIYVAGYAGGRSTVLRIALDTQGALPTLTSATTVAELPNGELIYALRGYLGTFLALGTSRGVRVAQIGSNGILDVGPLIETPHPVKALTAYSDAFYAGYTDAYSDGSSGLLRVSLTTQLPSGLYPYAPDLNAHVVGDVTGAAMLGGSGSLVLAVDGQGLYESSSELEESGFVQTFRIRYSTQWPKLYKRLSVRGAPPYDGTIAISTVDQSGTTTSLATVSPDLDPTQDLSIQFPQTPQQYIALKFQLNRSATDQTAGPTWVGYQCKAVPGGPRPRQFVIPVFCFDFETDRAGAAVGRDGWALERLELMEDADSAGDLVLFQDLTSGRSQLVLIESLEFSQNAPPNTGMSTGGILQITCRGMD